MKILILFLICLNCFYCDETDSKDSWVPLSVPKLINQYLKLSQQPKYHHLKLSKYFNNVNNDDHSKKSANYYNVNKDNVNNFNSDKFHSFYTEPNQFYDDQLLAADYQHVDHQNDDYSGGKQSQSPTNNHPTDNQLNFYNQNYFGIPKVKNTKSLIGQTNGQSNVDQSQGDYSVLLNGIQNVKNGIYNEHNIFDDHSTDQQSHYQSDLNNVEGFDSIGGAYNNDVNIRNEEVGQSQSGYKQSLNSYIDSGAYNGVPNSNGQQMDGNKNLILKNSDGTLLTFNDLIKFGYKIYYNGNAIILTHDDHTMAPQYNQHHNDNLYQQNVNQNSDHHQGQQQNDSVKYSAEESINKIRINDEIFDKQKVFNFVKNDFMRHQIPIEDMSLLIDENKWKFITNKEITSKEYNFKNNLISYKNETLNQWKGISTANQTKNKTENLKYDFNYSKVNFDDKTNDDQMGNEMTQTNSDKHENFIKYNNKSNDNDGWRPIVLPKNNVKQQNDDEELQFDLVPIQFKPIEPIESIEQLETVNSNVKIDKHLYQHQHQHQQQHDLPVNHHDNKMPSEIDENYLQNYLKLHQFYQPSIEDLQNAKSNQNSKGLINKIKQFIKNILHKLQ